MLAAVCDAAEVEIRGLYTKLEDANRDGPHGDQIGHRALKHHLLTLLTAQRQFKSAVNLTPRRRALVEQRVGEMQGNFDKVPRAIFVTLLNLFSILL
jgi:hypothetical protein